MVIINTKLQNINKSWVNRNEPGFGYDITKLHCTFLHTKSSFDKRDKKETTLHTYTSRFKNIKFI